MLPFLIRRFIAAFWVFAAVSLLGFLLLDLAPGDAADVMAGETASQEQIEEIRSQLGLTGPVLERYVNYMKGFTRGDLGESLFYARPVLEVISERFPHTLWLAVMTILVSLSCGLLIGSLAAWKPGKSLDLILMSLVSAGLSIPTFWVALMLILVFSLRLGWLPVLGNGSWQHIILPLICLSLPTTALIARLSRASILEVRGADYIRTAHAKGVRHYLVFMRHVLPNSLIPVFTVAGLYFAHILGGTFIIETLFAWPGLGTLVVQSIFNRDFPVILGAVLLIAGFYQVLNLLVDLVQVILDPRVREDIL